MGDSDMSPKARVTYDQHKFQVEFNVSEYLPEVSEAQSDSVLLYHCISYNLQVLWCTAVSQSKSAKLQKLETRS